MLELGSEWMSRKNALPDYRQKQMIIDKVVVEEDNKLITLYKLDSFQVYFTEVEVNQIFVPILKENNK